MLLSEFHAMAEKNRNLRGAYEDLLDEIDAQEIEYGDSIVFTIPTIGETEIFNDWEC